MVGGWIHVILLIIFYQNLPQYQHQKKHVHNYGSRLATSLVGEFNRIQVEDGSSTISDYSALTWLKKECPKHAIYPHKADYCDYCAKIKATIQEKQTSVNRKLQSGSAVATAENDQLDQLKHCFTLVISADYQLQKLVPYWGSSPQPGSTYYLQKLSYDLFGIVDHRNESSAVYIFDERVGTKTADHTISYILHYFKLVGKVPSWVTRFHVFLDNAGSTNKNQYLMSLCMELVQHRIFEYHLWFLDIQSLHQTFCSLRLPSRSTNLMCSTKQIYSS